MSIADTRRESISTAPALSGVWLPLVTPFFDDAVDHQSVARLTRRYVESGVDGLILAATTGEGLVHRLWEPLAAKHAPPSAYAAKFSMPYCMAVGFLEGDA
jgi:hypothetical protein